MEFFWLRMFPPNEYGYDGFTFCRRFAPFMFVSLMTLAYGCIHYLLMRVQMAFADSVFAFGTGLFIALRVFTFIALVSNLAFVVVVADGVPFNVETGNVTNDSPWLCRNAIKPDWPQFWTINIGLALFLMMAGNFMNWYL